MDDIDENLYWQPANSVEKLYAQFDGKRYRRIPRSEILVHENVGSGEFGTVAKGTWQVTGGKTTVCVAVKMLNSSSKDDRIRFLQEGAIMGQFRHHNIVSLLGLVLDGEPLMVAVEFMDNGDLKHYLQNLSQSSCKASQFLGMAREIATGMEYLARKAFIHRDLAVRNVMLDKKLTCKIGDFGLSRDLAESQYYMTHGGRIPIRWTAPEAVMYRKYSTASDVWSYGIVLYEIWTLGKRPYDDSWSNSYVIEMLDKGYRLPPPPGCSFAIYTTMIQCWHPDRHQRPSFTNIVHEFRVSDDKLLVNDSNVEAIRGRLGDAVDRDAGMYAHLQSAYDKISIVQ
jgi:serine/threonine protein kinase